MPIIYVYSCRYIIYLNFIYHILHINMYLNVMVFVICFITRHVYGKWWRSRRQQPSVTGSFFSFKDNLYIRKVKHSPHVFYINIYTYVYVLSVRLRTYFPPKVKKKMRINNMYGHIVYDHVTK